MDSQQFRAAAICMSSISNGLTNDYVIEFSLYLDNIFAKGHIIIYTGIFVFNNYI